MIFAMRYMRVRNRENRRKEWGQNRVCNAVALGGSACDTTHQSPQYARYHDSTIIPSAHYIRRSLPDDYSDNPKRSAGDSSEYRRLAVAV